MPKTDWRVAAEYDYVDGLDASGLAWEFLRRSPAYRADYARWAGRRDLGAAGGAISPEWGLRFRRRPGEPRA